MDKNNLKNWEIISRSLIIQLDPWLKLYKEVIRTPNGDQIDDYYTIDQRDFCVIFAVNNDQNVLCLWHYKHGPKAINLGLPAGYINDNEKPIDAAKRELLEETGYCSDKWEKIGKFSVDGNRGCGTAHLYFASDIYFKKIIESDDIEEAILTEVNISKLTDYLFDGSVSTAAASMTIALGLLFIKNK